MTVVEGVCDVNWERTDAASAATSMGSLSPCAGAASAARARWRGSAGSTLGLTFCASWGGVAAAAAAAEVAMRASRRAARSDARRSDSRFSSASASASASSRSLASLQTVHAQ